MQSQPVRPGIPRLSELAKHLVVPEGIVASDWPAVRARCADLGITFDPWQDGCGRLMLAKRADGRYAAGVGGVVMSIPRQVGKTFLLGATTFALSLIEPNLTVIWTSHRGRTASETFTSMQGFARREAIAPFVAKVVLGAGSEAIHFANGSRILFGARERGFGRGFSRVDVLVFDEAQILTENALTDMVPTQNTSPDPLLLFTGTPPRPTDPGEVFQGKRTGALAGTSTDTAYVEFGADDDADPDDRNQWLRANPSMPLRTPVSAVLRMQQNLAPESFLREALGLWSELRGHAIISSTQWATCLSLDSKIKAFPQFALDVAPDRSWAAIAVAGKDEEGVMNVQLTGYPVGGRSLVDYERGTDWVVERVVSLRARWGSQTRLAIASGSAAESLAPALEAAGISVDFVKSNDVASACGVFFDLATTANLRHLGDAEITSALEGARKTTDSGEGAWKWGRRRSAADISPLYAATLAIWAATRYEASDYNVAASIL